MDKVAVVFDDLGDMYEIDNIEGMLTDAELDAELIITLYKKTVEGHNLVLANEELVRKGYLDGSKNRPYNPTGVEYGIEKLKGWLVEQFGEKSFNKIHSEIDLSFMNNKPELTKKRKKK
jgi:hypothetical protein